MANQAKFKNTSFNVGDTVKVEQIIKEANKERSQIFEGVVIKIRGGQENKSFIVRKIASAGVAVERIWPLASPWIKAIKVVKHGKVRRAKLYYLRTRLSKRASRVREDIKKRKAILEEEKKDKKNKKEVVKSKKSPKKAVKKSLPKVA